MSAWIPSVILVETTDHGKRVKVDPVEWINWEFERNGHLDRFLCAILESAKLPRSARRAEPTSHV